MLVSAFLTIVVLLNLVWSTTPSGFTTVLSWTSQESIDGPFIASGTTTTMAVYSNRYTVQYAKSNNGGTTFTPLQLLSSGTKIYGLTIAAATTPESDGQFLLAFIDNMELKVYEYTFNRWNLQNPLAGQFAGVALCEGPGGDWMLVGAKINETPFVITRPKAPEPAVWTTPVSITKYSPSSIQNINWAGNVVLDRMKIACTFQGLCAFSWISQDPARRLNYQYSTTGFKYDETDQVSINPNTDSTLAILLGNNYTVVYYVMADPVYFTMNCLYNTITNIKNGIQATNFRGTSSKCPMLQAPKEQWDNPTFDIDVVQHYGSSSAYFLMDMVDTDPGFGARSYLSFTQTTAPFDWSIIIGAGEGALTSDGITIRNRGSAASTAVSGTNWVFGVGTKNDQGSAYAGKVLYKAHSLGNIIKDGQISTRSPTSPTSKQPTRSPTKIEPIGGPGGGDDTTTTANFATAISIATPLLFTFFFILLGVSNGVWFLYKFGDDMKLFQTTI